ncbi:MAG: tRNA pseudouridine(38-40) synthase TruA [Candidatus Nanopelagicales bacterium]
MRELSDALPSQSLGAQPQGVRLRLELAYDGTDFHGWARQPGLRTVQGELEAALSAIVRPAAETPLRVAVAGRTDAGVHARGQVCHCDLPPGFARRSEDAQAALEALPRRLNAVLPPDVRVRRLGIAPDGFDARWSALWRRYRYRVADPSTGYDPLTRHQVLWVRREVSLPAMQSACRPFHGEHDFAAYCKARPDASSVRTVRSLSWCRTDSELYFEITADAFCHSMVRSLVGAFLAVGEGRWAPERPGLLLASAQRAPGASIAPPHGLCLEEVGYPVAGELARQAAVAKRWRGR